MLEIVFFLVILAVMFFLTIAPAIWMFKDGKKRGKSTEIGLVLVLLNFVAPIITPIVYLFIRKNI